MHSPQPQQSSRRAIRVWLLAVAALMFATLVVGGATRLTESGLSIVELKPVGAVGSRERLAIPAGVPPYARLHDFRDGAVDRAAPCAARGPRGAGRPARKRPCAARACARANLSRRAGRGLARGSALQHLAADR